MASVIPSVIVSLVTLVAILGILGGIVQYYSNISMEPALLPAYGTIYVEQVDPNNLTVTVVNSYGHPVRALFSIRVVSSDKNVFPIVSFWYTILPGRNEIRLIDEVRRLLPVNASVNVDLSSSYFIIGGLRYPIAKGAGALKPYTSSSRTTKTYNKSGIGLLEVHPPYIYASLYFEGNKIDITNTLKTDFGYYRSVVDDFELVNVTVRREYGNVCSSDIKWYIRNVIITDPVTDGIYCGSVYEYYYDDKSVYYDRYYNSNFGCASIAPNGMYLSWLQVSSYISSSLRTAALYGATYFTKEFSADRVAVSGGGTGYVTKNYPYIKPDQECRYTYVEVMYSTSMSQEPFTVCNECPTFSCYTLVRNVCQQSSYTYIVPNQWACGSKKCAGTKNYLYARIRDMQMNVTVPLNTGGRILLRFNLTYILEYYFAELDPHISYSNMYVDLTNNIGLIFPSIAGYLNIRYGDDTITSIVVGLNAYVRNLTVRVTTASGFSTTATLFYSVTGGSSYASAVPVGFVAILGSNMESAKTYKFEAPNMYVGLNLRTVSYISVPLKAYDTIYVTIQFDLEIEPYLSFTVVGTS